MISYDEQAGVVNAVTSRRPPSRKLWHITGSKRRCWLPEKTTKCLWQEASMLCQRQQKSAFNCTQWQISSVHNLTIKDSTRRFVLLKLSTDRHEASRGLFATAELFVALTVKANNAHHRHHHFWPALSGQPSATQSV